MPLVLFTHSLLISTPLQYYYITHKGARRRRRPRSERTRPTTAPLMFFCVCTGSLQALLRHSVGRRHQAISNVWFRHLARGLVCRPPVVPLLAADVVAGLHWWRGNVLMLLGGFCVDHFCWLPSVVSLSSVKPVVLFSRCKTSLGSWGRMGRGPLSPAQN